MSCLRCWLGALAFCLLAWAGFILAIAATIGKIQEALQ